MKIMAHRGYSGKYPENTMLAFEEAAKGSGGAGGHQKPEQTELSWMFS